MSARDEITYFQEVKAVSINTLTAEALLGLAEKCKLSVEQKLEKLHIILKPCDVYVSNNSILINDRYKLCRDLEEIAAGFGFNIRKLDCSLKGNTFVLYDELIDIYSILTGSMLDLSSIESKSLTYEIRSLIASNSRTKEIGVQERDIIANILKNGSYKTSIERTVTHITNSETYYDYKKYGDWSDISNIEKGIKELANRAKDLVNKTNLDLRNGTTALIRSRARSMGYAVQEQQNGDEIQLVLVRLN